MPADNHASDKYVIVRLYDEDGREFNAMRMRPGDSWSRPAHLPAAWAILIEDDDR